VLSISIVASYKHTLFKKKVQTTKTKKCVDFLNSLIFKLILDFAREVSSFLKNLQLEFNKLINSSRNVKLTCI
jgi:hypothetical protein